MTHPATATADTRPSVRVEQARLVQSNLGVLALGNLLASGGAAWVLWGVVAEWPLLLWLAAQWLDSAYGAWMARRLRARPAHERNAARRLRLFVWGMAVTSSLWALGLLTFWPVQRPELALLLVVLTIGSLAAVLHACLAWLPAFHAYLLPCVVGVVGGALWAGGPVNHVVALAGFMYAGASLRMARRMHTTLMETLHSRHQLARMAADLAAQRDRAEQASAAKSRFLAAASHDLRQPVHALTLMLSAWRAQPPGPEAEHLRGRVEATVAAMGSLFNALLDMSRLDAGVAPLQPQRLALDSMVQRLVSEMREQAQARGLRLRCNTPCGPGLGELTVVSDGLLLERVLRNLLTNAVRYTVHGGVLVSVRARGSLAVIRVVDSGPGIAPDQQEAVFQEFVQLHNAERDRSQGLGLGLPIVRRLCALLQVDLRMRSRVGHGTAFTLRLPLASPQAVQAGAVLPNTLVPDLGARPSDPEEPLLVVVVDDDTDILTGMRSLLQSWGHEVLAAGSGRELQAALLNLSRAPGLLISDFRLRDQETGLDVVRQLREEFNDEDLPALLITGDTSPERLREAQASGLRVLHKPLDAAQLRQEISAASRRSGMQTPERT